MDVDRYLERIGYEGPREADERTLAALQRAHLLTVPFDSLDCLLGNRVTVEPEDAYRKVVEARRGGFCFERRSASRSTAARFAGCWSRPV
jgi:N-hydroxyarylamine O-acetyltransferase